LSIQKIVGIEQEYAIKIKGGYALSAFDASCMLVNAYARKLGLREPGMSLLWDYGHETPYQDIRGKLFGKSTGQEIIREEENLLINASLPNGARLYTDHAHPEYSTPECLGARDVAACDKAGEKILIEALRAVNDTLPSSEIALFKNNSDHQGHSYGCHENYLVEAGTHEEYLVRSPQKALGTLVPFLITRQIFAGTGKVGGKSRGSQKRPYQIYQRADFMESLFGLETMYARPIINTREEHHADPKRFRRLHLILGDANMCEFATFLKVGSTQIVLQMLEDGFFTEDLTLKDPLNAVKKISAEYNGGVELADGRSFTAVELQWRFLERAREYQKIKSVSHVPDMKSILECWAYALDGLEQLRFSSDFAIEEDPMGLQARLDWVLKLWLINRFRQGKNLEWDDPQLKVLDLQYHNIDTQEGIFYRLQRQGLVERIVDDKEVNHYIQNAPGNTRAYFRGKCIEKFPQEIRAVNWEIVGFDQGEIHRMVPLLNPLKGTFDQFGRVFDQSQSVPELLDFIGAGQP
jgi:proteasome accessory factor A